MLFIVMFVSAVCVLFPIKLQWPKKKIIYDTLSPSQKRLPFSTFAWCGQTGTTRLRYKHQCPYLVINCYDWTEMTSCSIKILNRQRCMIGRRNDV